jgi:hypothetical protein
MQTLGLSDSTPKPENRLKTLFWPDIRHAYDADNLAQQGFWVCWIVAGASLVFGYAVSRSALVLVDVSYLLLAGIGVRQGSKFAAVMAFVNYLGDTLLGGFGVASIFFLALLLANIRGTWLAARWRATATEPPPLPLTETFMDRVCNRLPVLVWPVGRGIFYPLAVLETAGLLLTWMK